VPSLGVETERHFHSMVSSFHQTYGADKIRSLYLSIGRAPTHTQEQDADCVYCTRRSSEGHKGEEWVRCAKYFREAHTICAGMEEDFICKPCQG
jgi:hypothetical protein